MQPKVAVDGDGKCVVLDEGAWVVLLFRPARGTVSFLAGSGERGGADGAGAAASSNRPLQLCVDRAGRVGVLRIDNV